MKDELELNLMDLIMKIVLKWRFIVVSILISAVLFGALGAFKNLTKDEVVEVIDMDAIQNNVNALEKELSEWDANVVKGAVNTNLAYKGQFEYYVDYFENSILMNIDANNVSTLQKICKITANELAPEKENAIAKTLAWMVNSEEVYQQISEQLDTISNLDYVRELIEISAVEDGLFTITVMGTDNNQCNMIMNVFEEVITTSASEIEKVYGEFELLSFQNKVSQKRNEAIENKQYTVRNNFLSLNNKIKSLDDNFSENQLKYYKALLRLSESENDEKLEESVQESIVQQKKSLISKKYIVLGAFLGLVFAFGFLVVGYVFSPYLRKKDDLQLVFGIPNYAVIVSSDIKKKFLNIIDKTVYRIFNGNNVNQNALESACVNIESFAKKNSISNIYLATTCSDKEVTDYIQEVYRKLKPEFTINYGEFSEKTPQNLKILINAQTVILFEKVGASKNANIQRVLDVCEIHEICVIGSVIVDTY